MVYSTAARMLLSPAISFITFLMKLTAAYQFSSSCDVVEFALKSYGVVPDLVHTLPAVPIEFIKVTYSNNLQVILGNFLGLDQVQEQPICVQFNVRQYQYYTIILLDPDVPSRTNTSLAQVRHWHVGNIPGDDVAAGEALAVYMMPIPDPGTGPHRYVFLSYGQKSKLVFTEERLLNTTGAGRTGFSIDNYVKKYDLKLIAANFFQTAAGNNDSCRKFEPVPTVNNFSCNKD